MSKYAVIEFKGKKKLFDYVPITWLYYFESSKFKAKTLRSFVCFWHNDRKLKAPLKRGDTSNTSAGFERKEFEFYKVYVHYLYGKL